MARENKVLTHQETEHIINKLKSGISINHLRNQTGYGVNILKRIRDENNIPYCVKQSHEGRVTEKFASIFTVDNSTTTNETLKSCIKKHNLIPYTTCHICGLSEWLHGTINLQLDHINGNNKDQRLENLRFLCPNCHSQTPTYCGKNKNTGKKTVTDKKLTKLLKKEKNIHKALKKAGLTVAQGNYERAHRLQ